MKMYSFLPFILAVSVFAQPASKPTEPVKPAVTNVDPAAQVTAKPSSNEPALTTTEQAAAREFANEYSQIRKAVEQVNAEMNSFQEDVKKNHPGFQFDLQQNKLVAIPPKAPDTKGK